MPRADRTDEAREDLEGIWEYLAGGNLGAADRFLDVVDQTMDLLAKFPHLGSPRDDLRPGLRAMTVRRYQHVLFFCPT